MVMRRLRGFPNFVDDWLADSDEVVSLMHRPPLTHRKIPDTYFCYGLSRSQGHSAAGRFRTVEKSNGLFGSRTCDLSACSIVPQPTTLPLTPQK
jgi:hypothetical protein